MAKILPLLGEMTGSVAGNTFARNRGGSYVRARAAGTNPNTVKQQLARASLSNTSAGFAAISQANKDLWNDYARKWSAIQPRGSQLTLSGHQLYVAHNTARRYAGMASVSTPPTAVRPSILTATTVNPHETAADLTWAPTPLGSGQRVILWQGPPHNGGRHARFRDAQIASVTDSATGTSPDNTPLAFPMLIGQTSDFWVAHIDTGIWVISPMIRLSATRAT